MARDYKKNYNITMPIPRNSEVLRELLADAGENNMLHLIGIFSGTRLAEYYKARREGRILPEGTRFPAPYLQPPAWGIPAGDGAVPPAIPPPFQPGQRGSSGHQPAQSDAPSLKELEQLKNRPEVIKAAGADNLDASDLAFFLEDGDE